jgi:hypothetical protein
MTIAFATAISSHELEDKVIAALSDLGFTLSFRALTPIHLENYLETNDIEERRLLIFDDTFRHCVGKGIYKGDNQLALLLLHSSVVWTNEEIVKAAHEALRQPSIPKTLPRRSELRVDWFGVLGTSGSPGISSMAINIAADFAEKFPTQIIDADKRNQDLHILLGARREGRSSLTSSLALRTIDSEDDYQSLDREESCVSVIDLGEAPKFHHEIFSDRRANIRKSVDLIVQSRQLIYVLQPENRALIELDAFLNFAENELSGNQVTFLLNKMGNSTRHKGIFRSLKNRLSNQALFVVPRDYALFDRAQARFATLGEVGARTSVKRAISELSIYLAKSI